MTASIAKSFHEIAGHPDDLFLRRLTVEQYHRMIDAAILGEDEQVELVEGWLIAKMPKNPPHSKSTGRVQRQLDHLLPPGYFTRVQEPVTLADGEPEPDVSVVRGNDDQYTDRHPSASDTPLVVEVADSSLTRDRTIKLRSYARAGIAVYWIVNLIDRVIEVYSRPTVNGDAADYAQRDVYAEDQSVPVVLDGTIVGSVRVVDLLA